MDHLKLVMLNPAEVSTEEALQVLDDLRAAVESGEVVAFLAAAVTPTDEVLSYSATTRGVSRLRTIGAMTCTIAAMTSGEV